MKRPPHSSPPRYKPDGVRSYICRNVRPDPESAEDAAHAGAGHAVDDGDADGRDRDEDMNLNRAFAGTYDDDR